MDKKSWVSICAIILLFVFCAVLYRHSEERESAWKKACEQRGGKVWRSFRTTACVDPKVFK